MSTATRIKALSMRGDADQALYRLDPPYALVDWDGNPTGDTTEHVMVSATNVMFSGPETYIFPADEHGEVTDWGELPGSYKGGYDHAEALNGLGYEVPR